MRHLAIIGSGPAGYYSAEAAQKAFGDDVRVDIFDRLPVPFGLIRSGVAPDHQSIKGVARRYEKTALTDNVRFVGNVSIGEDVTIAELHDLYDAVILATGAPQDRTLDLPGQDLGNVFGSAAFVGWYNGHPQFTDLDPDLSGETAVIIGMGNVALDIARILSKTDEEFAGSDITANALEQLNRSNIKRIIFLGRRGPHDIRMTPKELAELGKLQRAAPCLDPDDFPPVDSDQDLDPGLRKSVTLLREFAQENAPDKPLKVEFMFWVRPQEIKGAQATETMLVERTRLEGDKLTGTGETVSIPASLVVSAIGYRTSMLPGVPYDDRGGRFANDDGLISPGLYCVGWARRGPTGTIGTNRPDGYAVIDRIAAELPETGSGKEGRAGFDRLAQKKDLEIVTFQNWKKIEEAEETAARDGSPREKFTDIAEMIRAANAPH
ncbi:FAD-dependent oxidoreductase [Altericroceibacterium endophyticum]|uniref:NAD(P)-binding protein n=1 Tax=Altericroceibacterium endophyticum TaxID=1808508 RepID=A0A6I4T387_9SPHN|nr:FAD-dependent oxidoreductase [Altericroceibacterium endophyticum]MXO64709.1 NAD(P)-binding protein [Altericroceibacterium endophyticum]